MKKVKWSVTGREIDDAPDDDFEEYDGEDPGRGVFHGRIKWARYTESSKGNPMIKVLVVLDGKASGRPELNGWPGFTQVMDMPTTIGQMKRFRAALGATARDFDSTMIDDDGTIVKMGRIKPTGMLVRFSTKVEEYPEGSGLFPAKVNNFLPPKAAPVEEPEDEDVEYEDAEDGVEYEDDGEEAEEEYEDDGEDGEYEEEEEAEEEPPPPPRRAAKKAAPAAKRAPAKAAPAAAPARKAAPAKKGAPVKKAAPVKRTRAAAYDEEPPF
jgi:hypothetical protein